MPHEQGAEFNERLWQEYKRILPFKISTMANCVVIGIDVNIMTSRTAGVAVGVATLVLSSYAFEKIATHNVEMQLNESRQQG